MTKYYLESLGCPKNLVDAHGMTRLLEHLGHRPVDDVRQAQVIIVNTCGFVEAAREESLGELRRLARRKRKGQVLIAAGCLAEYWGEAVAQAVPGVDALLGTRRWAEIAHLVESLEPGFPAKPGRGRRQRRDLLGDSAAGAEDAAGPRTARQGATAYLKIAEGCSAPCAFCAIPLIKGPAASRPVDDIVANAVELVQEGVKEIILIAQDTTAYGRDRGERDALPGLLQGILDALPAEGPRGQPWLRLMYAYPGHISPRLVEVMAGDARVCHYLDLPLQHAHPDVLRRMKRPADVDRTRRLVEDLRRAMPDIALRTAFIVGYPGETEAEFQALLDFMDGVGFDRVGAFLFSPEPGTAAADLPDPVPEEVKAERYERLMAFQQEISLEVNQAQVGRRLDVLVEGQGEGLSVGRSYRDAPEIDGMVILPGELPVGQIVAAQITGAMEYDLVGQVESET
ncbi:MAG: 30S ribosomal protein S12 methylthiotransferase RimO [Anaerolineae bacterium]